MQPRGLYAGLSSGQWEGEVGTERVARPVKGGKTQPGGALSGGQQHSEQVIQALRQQLEVELREAEDAEQRVATHPGAARLVHDRSDPTE